LISQNFHEVLGLVHPDCFSSAAELANQLPARPSQCTLWKRVSPVLFSSLQVSPLSWVWMYLCISSIWSRHLLI